MKTEHRIFFQSSEKMDTLPSGSVDLIVTSPPYPMIAMWDDMFCSQDQSIKNELDRGRGVSAFERMHGLLDKVWDEAARVLKEGGFACINIGDAARTINGHFMLYPNHSRILSHMVGKEFTPLPAIIWRKQTNAPNKFMGSGMLPAGAYVTLEHEYILILRKGGKRTFPKDADKMKRRASAIFWEERNDWFSDIWTDLKGTPQKLPDERVVRKRSGAFPFELPYRLINMFSIKEDMVVDPFCGTGTTTLASMAAGRNSTGFEIERSFWNSITAQTVHAVDASNKRIEERLKQHLLFVKKKYKEDEKAAHINRYYDFPVMTSQEKDMRIHFLTSIRQTGEHRFEAAYSDKPRITFSPHSSLANQ
jgi:modification methylase